MREGKITLVQNSQPQPSSSELHARIVRYWDLRMPDFARLREKEFAGEKHDLWLNELEKYIPPTASARILDCGTGTGFFAFLLAARGHTVSAIDVTPSMIHRAKEIGQQLESTASFFIMDAENPDFSPESFDFIVTRNLTWTLPRLDRAYQSWFKLLRPGGMLINIDGDYVHENIHSAMPAHHAHENIDEHTLSEYENIKDILRPGQPPRPHWDTLLLSHAGFHDIHVDDEIWQRVYGERDEFFNPTPIFCLSARRPARTASEQNMCEKTFGNIDEPTHASEMTHTCEPHASESAHASKPAHASEPTPCNERISAVEPMTEQKTVQKTECMSEYM